MQISLLRILTLLVLCVSWSPLQAQMYQNLTIGNTKAISLANAVTADPPGVDSIHFNPAGLTQAVEQGSLKEYHLLFSPKPKITFETKWTGNYSDENIIFGGCDAECLFADEEPVDKTTTVDEFLVYIPTYGNAELSDYNLAPRFGAAYRLEGTRFVAATSTYIVMASGQNLQTGDAGSYPNKSSSVMDMVLLAPSLAYEVSDKFSVGLSMPIHTFGMTMDAHLRSPNMFIATGNQVLNEICETTIGDQLCGYERDLLSPYDELVVIQAEAEDLITPSFNLGFLWHPTAWLTVGGVYQSEVSHKAEGPFRLQYSDGFAQLVSSGVLDVAPGSPRTDLDDNNGEEGNITIQQVLPMHYSFGVSLRITPRAKFNIDYKFTEFSKWQSLDLQFNQPTYITSLAGVYFQDADDNEIPLPLQYEDGSNWAFGFSYQWSDRLLLRAGYEFRPTVIPADRRDLIVPISDLTISSLGFSYQMSKSITVDLAVSHTKSSEFIPEGTSYYNTWDASEFFATYPGYDLYSSMEATVMLLTISKREF